MGIRKQPRVLIITPTHEPRKDLLKDVLTNIAMQNYQNYNGLVLVNNSSPGYPRYIVDLIGKIFEEHDSNTWFTVKDLGTIPKKNNYKGSISSVAYNHGLDRAIEDDYDYALLVQDDIAIPDTCIREQLKIFRKFKDCGIACLTIYHRWSGDGGGLEGVMSKISEALEGVKTLNVDQKLPMVKALKGRMDARTYYRKKYIKVLAGDGAMMIPRKVFMQIKMREEKKDGKYGNDYSYCMDTLEKLGLHTYINTSIYTPHMHLQSDGKKVIY